MKDMPTTIKAEEIIQLLEELRNEEQRKVLSRFFKTGTGEYGEGDLFLGLKVPQTRSIVKEIKGEVSLSEISRLLDSEWHEVRLCGFLLIVELMKDNLPKRRDTETQLKSKAENRREIAEFYVSKLHRANNWDLIDLSTEFILGPYLRLASTDTPYANFKINSCDTQAIPDYTLLKKLAASKNLWEQRAAIVTTLDFVRNGILTPTLEISDLLLSHPHDLIHKAVGWLLREVGKKDIETLNEYLDRNSTKMARTTLRYAIEKLSPDERQFWLTRKSPQKTQEIVFSNNPSKSLAELLDELDYDRLFIITDSNVSRIIENPHGALSSFLQEYHPEMSCFEAGEKNKTISTVSTLWQMLSEKGATRQSIVINIGGGVTTDLGGFVAATFKRGIRCINLPTTLLAIVDASVGGKTGFDFNGLKNEIGVFSKPLASVIYPDIIDTLPHEEMLSGMAEVVKTAMISNKQNYTTLLKNFHASPKIIEDCVTHKIRITTEDPLDKGVRKILNFGHTAGHAYEALLLEKGKPEFNHGICVAHGILVALILSHLKLGLPSSHISIYKQQILSNYPALPVGCKDVDALITLMAHDKKNRKDEIRFVLLKDIAQPEYDIPVTSSELKEALEIAGN